MARKYIASRIAATSALAALAVSPAFADVKDGVDAWSRGDFAAAIAEWQGPAAAGDADAMFNLAQAYRLGRGVPQDLTRAEDLYRRAAEGGHLQAADTYGLMLFQEGRREIAMPYIEAAARRGDPRSQYLLGIAHFNGDVAPKDWVKAYALLTLANGSGLPQASAAIEQMDQHIPIEQRQEGAALASTMTGEMAATRSAQFASAELGVITPATPAPAPEPISDSPANAGASFTQVDPNVSHPIAQKVEIKLPEPAAVAEPVIVAKQEPKAEPKQEPKPAAKTGPWRVQLGAFGVAGNAERLWTKLSSRKELAGYERLLVPAGKVTKLQAGGFATREDAQQACSSLKASGQDCLVTRN